MRRVLVLMLLLSLIVPVSAQPQLATIPTLKDNRLTVDLGGIKATVSPAVLSEPGYVTVTLDKAPLASKVDLKLTSDTRNFLTKTESTTMKDRGFKVWVDVPWNGPGSSGKYNLTVTLDGTDYVIDPWWNLTWYHSQKLSFDTLTTGITQNLVDFPVMVRLDNTRVNWTDIQADGDDLRFIDADNVTVLSYEIERFTYGAEAIVWVRVPQIDANSTTDHIWMYYDNPAASSGEDAANVWTADHVLVQHFNEGTGTAANDSSPAGNDGTLNGPPTWVTDPIDGSLDFDGTNDYIEVADDDSLDFGVATDLTLSVWLKSDTLQNKDIVIKNNDVGTAWLLFRQGRFGAAWYVFVQIYQDAGNQIYSKTFGDLSDSDWHLVTVVLNRSAVGVNQLKTYFDGGFHSNAQAVIGMPNITSVAPLRIAKGDKSGGYFTGLLDELRIIRDTQTLSEVKGDYYSGIDTFISYDQPWTGVTLNIVNPSGSAVPDALVSIYQHEALVATRLSRADGTFHYPLDAGDYVIYVNAENYKTSSTTVTVAGAYVAETVTLLTTGGGLNDTAFAWAVFFTAATVLMVAPRFLGDRRLREVCLLFSMLLWVAAIYTWVVGFTNTGLYALVYLHLAPLLLISGLLLVEIGENLSKRDKYERI